MKVLSIYFFVLGWVSIFSLHPYLPMPMMFGLLLLALCIAYSLAGNIVIKHKGVILLLYFFIFSLFEFTQNFLI